MAGVSAVGYVLPPVHPMTSLPPAGSAAGGGITPAAASGAAVLRATRASSARRVRFQDEVHSALKGVHLVVNWRTIWAQDEPLCMFYVGTCPLPLPRCRVVP